MSKNKYCFIFDFLGHFPEVVLCSGKEPHITKWNKELIIVWLVELNDSRPQIEYFTSVF